MSLFSFIHYFCRLGGLEFPWQKPCWFVLLIVSLLRWFVIQSLITFSTHLSGMSRCSMGWQLPGAQELQVLPMGAGRAGTSPAKARPTTPSKGAGQAEGGGSWRHLRDRIINWWCLYWRGRCEVKPGSEPMGQCEEENQWGTWVRHRGNADEKWLSGAKGLSLKAVSARGRCRASLELFSNFSLEQFSSAGLECG